MGDIIDDIRLDCISKKWTLVRIKLKDGSEICLPEERLLETVGYHGGPLEWMTISGESMNQYKKSLSDQKIFQRNTQKIG